MAATVISFDEGDAAGAHGGAWTLQLVNAVEDRAGPRAQRWSSREMGVPPFTTTMPPSSVRRSGLDSEEKIGT